MLSFQTKSKLFRQCKKGLINWTIFNQFRNFYNKQARKVKRTYYFNLVGNNSKKYGLTTMSYVIAVLAVSTT